MEESRTSPRSLVQKVEYNFPNRLKVGVMMRTNRVFCLLACLLLIANGCTHCTREFVLVNETDHVVILEEVYRSMAPLPPYGILYPGAGNTAPVTCSQHSDFVVLWKYFGPDIEKLVEGGSVPIEIFFSPVDSSAVPSNFTGQIQFVFQGGTNRGEHGWIARPVRKDE